MAIKARCGSCNTGFSAKDSLAGKRVKCPKCKSPLVIPKPAARKPAEKAVISAPAKKPVPSNPMIPHAAAHNPLLDLLDEAGVDSVASGPCCDNCGTEISPTAIVCVECGFNMATGQRIETTVFDEDDDDDFEAGGMTDTEKIIRKAEREIEETPVSHDGDDFGEGADSFVIAAVAIVIFVVLVGIGLATIFMMDQLTTIISSAMISFLASTGLVLMCIAWITIVAFMANKKQGIICLATLGLYCPIFGFMQGKSLMLPTLIMLFSIVIGLVSAIFAFKEKPTYALMMFQNAMDLAVVLKR